MISRFHIHFENKMTFSIKLTLNALDMKNRQNEAYGKLILTISDKGQLSCEQCN